jgi:nitroimidazol reductase NimA-like FMN-containing flavoprotein (pyridoxamine 5'-phosphate oxidase superfamily)
MSYTQSPPLTKDEIESFLQTSRIARLCSFNENETIHAVPVWYLYEEGAIIISSPEGGRKVKNAKRNNNVTVLIDNGENAARGVIIYGKADVNDKEIASTMVSLFEKYAPGDKIEKTVQNLFKIAKWVKIVIVPEQIVSFDASKDVTYQSALQE